MSDAPTFAPTPAELEMLRRLESGEPMPFPENIKKDFSDRLYENGFVTVGLDGGLALTERGHELFNAHSGAEA